MPGKKITDHQVHRYKHHRKTLTQVASAAKTGISERSARRIESSPTLPSQTPERAWRTRSDPLSVVWDAEVVPLLQTDAQLGAVTLLEALQIDILAALSETERRSLQTLAHKALGLD